MSLKSIMREIREVRNGIGNISRRRSFDVRVSHHHRPRSQAPVDDILSRVLFVQQSRWANLPPELLHNVIQRLEASECTWPGRKNVVACAAVWKSWRQITKEVVKTPEQCGKLTFPISLKQPGPRDAPMQCFIKRDRSNSTYHLFLGLTPEHKVEIALQSSEKNETAADSQRVKDTESITESIDREQNESGDNQRETDTKFIARVPKHALKDMKTFVPQVVSLGPFHYRSPKLPKLAKHEDLKEKHLLPDDRLSSFDVIISQKIKLIQRWYYAEGEYPHKDEELGRMMARDGLFLLRFLKEMQSTERRSDKLFEPKRQIQQDIMKLENQIPFFVVKMVFEWEADTDKGKAGTDGMWDFMKTLLRRSCIDLCPFRVDPFERNLNSHLLGFMYDNIIGSSDDSSTYHSEHNLLRRMTSIISLLKALKDGENQMSKDKPDNSLLSAAAAELEGKGVNFTAIKSPLALNQIRFDDITCRFYLPIIEMDSTTNVVMRNLLAFELYVCKGGTKPLRCYIDLMERLIDNVEDVKVLRDAGIIRNHLSNDKEVANVWNAMRGVLGEKGKYRPIDTAVNDVTDFYNDKYRTMWAEFKKKYFSRPWVVVALVGGIIQLFLSLLQTILAWEQRKPELPDSSVYPPNRQGIRESGNRQGIVSESVKNLGETIPNSEPNPFT